jgi:hypothetical protein
MYAYTDGNLKNFKTFYAICAMEKFPTTNNAPGDSLTTKSQVLETGASAIQNFAPLKHICAHLNAFHAYTSEPTRCVEANHYCTHLNEGIGTEVVL